MDTYQQTIHKTRYARYITGDKRREEFGETVWRYVDYFKEAFPSVVTEGVAEELADSILSMRVMPSMRALMTAGPALSRDHVAGFNCAYVAVDNTRAFDETVYILMCGCGVGYSVERESVRQLPAVAQQSDEVGPHIEFEDSRIGWASGFRVWLEALWEGLSPTYDLSQLRPAGAVLKTFGGRSSGPAPLRKLLDYTAQLFNAASGRQLTTLECHDIMCKIAEVVVSGGVRRSALICLSNLSDYRIRDCKTGLWQQTPEGTLVCTEPQRQLSNNSTAYTCKPDVLSFMDELSALIRSKSGERGIFNREAAQKQAARFGGRDAKHAFGGNPCLEIILRSAQFCNLTEIVVRPEDTLVVLLQKAKLATILGTLQATQTDFRYLRPIWKKNTEEEALLGVSLTGIMDHPLLSGSTNEPDKCIKWLASLSECVKAVNEKWAAKLGINAATSWSCVKPSGTVSQLVDSASGIHSRYAEFYTRRIRNSKQDPASDALIRAGVPYEADLSKPTDTWVFSFPIKAPKNAVVGNGRSAIEQLEHWLLYRKHWATHTVSITVYVREHEWLEVGAWVYKNFDAITGVSFLPYSDGKDDNGHSYPQAPYEELTEEQYEAAVSAAPKTIDWDMVEESDMVEGIQTLACVAGVCDI